MITDALINFLPPSTNLAVTNTTLYSNVVDQLGIGVGVTPAQGNVIIGQTVTKFGADQGVGVVVPELLCAVGTAFAGTGTLTVTFEGAQDNGSGSPATYKVYDQSPAMTVAQLVAASFFFRRKWPIEYPDGDNPRFFRLGFAPSGTFTAGTVAYAVVTMGPWANFSRYQGRNYVVAG